MAVPTFDTLKFANALKAAGCPPERAEAQTILFAELTRFYLAELVTRAELEREIETLRRELKAKTAETKEIAQRTACPAEHARRGSAVRGTR